MVLCEGNSASIMVGLTLILTLTLALTGLNKTHPLGGLVRGTLSIGEARSACLPSVPG